jgi:thiol:disulfide interchange protein DsbD
MSYAFGIGLLFLMLGTFPALLTKMPRSGGWMEDVKKLLGAVLIGVSLYYLQFARVPAAVYWPLVLSAAIGGALVIALRAGMRQDTPLRFNLWRGSAVALAAFGVYIAVAKVPTAIVSNPSSRGGYNSLAAAPETGSAAALGQAMAGVRGGAGSDGMTTGGLAANGGNVLGRWLTSEAEGLAAGKSLGLPVMLDFRADWCAACIELEKNTFPNPAVETALASGFVKVKIDATEPNDEIEALMRKYKAVSLPTVAFVDRLGQIRHEHALYTFEAPERFLKRLEAVSALK